MTTSLPFRSQARAQPDRRFSIALGASAAIHASVLLIGLLAGREGRFEPSRFLVVSVLPTTSPAGAGERLIREGAAGSRARPKTPGQPRVKPAATQATAPPFAPPSTEPGQAIAEPKPPKGDTTSRLPAAVSPSRTGASQAQGARASDATSASSHAGESVSGDSATGIAGAKPGPYRPGSGVTAPRLVHKVQPAYPEAARDAGIQGAVELEIVVTAAGQVMNITVLGVPARDMGFETAAINAVRQWKFLPGSFKGTPVDVFARVVVTFTIEH